MITLLHCSSIENLLDPLGALLSCDWGDWSRLIGAMEPTAKTRKRDALGKLRDIAFELDVPHDRRKADFSASAFEAFLLSLFLISPFAEEA